MARRTFWVHHSFNHFFFSFLFTVLFHSKPPYVGCRCVYLLPATCTFGRMTGIVYVLLRGWNGYRNKSQHRKLTLEMKILLPSSMPGLEPATSRVRRSTGHWAAPLPPPLTPPTPHIEYTRAETTGGHLPVRRRRGTLWRFQSSGAV